jgi:hypothetical protein
MLVRPRWKTWKAQKNSKSYVFRATKKPMLKCRASLGEDPLPHFLPRIDFNNALHRLLKHQAQILEAKVAEAERTAHQKAVADAVAALAGEKKNLMKSNGKLRSENSELRDEVEELKAMVELLKGQRNIEHQKSHVLSPPEVSSVE